ncbi:kinesin family member 3 [Phytophthora cinnamomi]|uniref:kinesin family member 3 n=1 Tax=Phytophthora cinnamomi TaxID=4785 RepID=UPI00355A03E1|nr:kinesin family member 3 [Phytophthora cinnamomi]
MMTRRQIRAGIRVCARFRPQNKLEQKHQAVECVLLEDSTAAHVHSEARGVSDDHTFTFDQVFGTTSSQLEVYEATAKPLVESALRGYNCTCFVYGQTGSGKTFSMEGVPGDADFEGIIPRVMADIFDGIQNMQSDLEFIVRVSYVEIYMEKIRDLLKPTSTNLNVRESRERGVWIAGATEVCCASVEEMQDVMRLGGANRVISSTRMNNESSRSHSVFIITIEQRNTTTGSMKSGKLFLVDLAGSEKVGKTHAKGQTLKEAQHINKSLSALGSVMNALTSGNASTHIPYRDSKLTRLLQDSLGGNSETTLLVCASSSSYNSEETVSTLRKG